MQDRVPDLLTAVAQYIATTRYFPESTYCLQFHAGLTFRDTLQIVPYLHAFGITHCYASPLLQARPGSTHGTINGGAMCSKTARLHRTLASMRGKLYTESRDLDMVLVHRLLTAAFHCQERPQLTERWRQASDYEDDSNGGTGSGITDNFYNNNKGFSENTPDLATPNGKDPDFT